MNTFVPLPSWADLASAAVSACPTDKELAQPWLKDDNFVLWFSRSAWAMWTISEWWKASHDNQAPHVWLPDYFCSQSADLLRETGARLSFYPIGPNLEPHWADCRELLTQGPPPDLFFLVHYFGHALDGHAAAAFCQTSGALLVEDAAHVLTPANDIGAYGDFIFFSPHKLLPTPDGALLLIRNLDALPDAGKPTEFLSCKRAQPAWTWITKRSLQKFAPSWILRNRIQGMPGFDVDLGGAAREPDRDMSKTGRRLIARYATKLSGIAAQRKEAAKVWREYFSGAGDGSEPFFDLEEEGPAPYRFTLKCPDKSSASAHFTSLRQKGIAVETWPDLAPAVTADPNRHKTAMMLRDHLLFLPVHGSCTPNAFEDANN